MKNGIDFDYTLILISRGVTSFLFLKGLNPLVGFNPLMQKGHPIRGCPSVTDLYMF